MHLQVGWGTRSISCLPLSYPCETYMLRPSNNLLVGWGLVVTVLCELELSIAVGNGLQALRSSAHLRHHPATHRHLCAVCEFLPGCPTFEEKNRRKKKKAPIVTSFVLQAVHHALFQAVWNQDEDKVRKLTRPVKRQAKAAAQGGAAEGQEGGAPAARHWGQKEDPEREMAFVAVHDSFGLTPVMVSIMKALCSSAPPLPPFCPQPSCILLLAVATGHIANGSDKSMGHVCLITSLKGCAPCTACTAAGGHAAEQ